MKELSACGNALTELPEEIEHLVRLETLALDNNQLAGLPLTMGALQKKKLKFIKIRNNPIKDSHVQNYLQETADGGIAVKHLLKYLEKQNKKQKYVFWHCNLLAGHHHTLHITVLFLPRTHPFPFLYYRKRGGSKKGKNKKKAAPQPEPEPEQEEQKSAVEDPPAELDVKEPTPSATEPAKQNTRSKKSKAKQSDDNSGNTEKSSGGSRMAKPKKGKKSRKQRMKEEKLARQRAEVCLSNRRGGGSWSEPAYGTGRASARGSSGSV